MFLTCCININCATTCKLPSWLVIWSERVITCIYFTQQFLYSFCYITISLQACNLYTDIQTKYFVNAIKINVCCRWEKLPEKHGLKFCIKFIMFIILFVTSTLSLRTHKLLYIRICIVCIHRYDLAHSVWLLK